MEKSTEPSEDTIRGDMSSRAPAALAAARRHPSLLLAGATAIVFIAIWHAVITGDRVLVGGDVLYAYPPWRDTPQAHPPTNWLTADVIREFVPWLGLERQALLAGHLPLWDPTMLGGKPLLANDQSAFFSPFTWIAMLFGGTHGYSLAMLAKLLSAGAGTVVFLRLLRMPSLAAAVGGLAFATCSYVVLWLGWPHSSVAVLAPWVFAAVEAYLLRPGVKTAIPVAAIVGIQFMAGHPETSIVLAEGLAIYVAVRLSPRMPHRVFILAGLGLAGALGTALAAIQLVPFFAQFSQTTLGTYHPAAGLFHLPPSSLSSWLAPNLYGNPGIDGLVGRPPHYNASTGFIGVGIVTLAIVGATARGLPWRPRLPFVLMLLFSLAMVYGALTGIVGALPILRSTNSAYTILLSCFSLACLAGFGVQGLLQRPPSRSMAGGILLVVGLVGVAALALLALAFAIFRVRVENRVPRLPAVLHGGFGFWALVAGASLLGAVCLARAAWLRCGRLPMAGLLTLVLVEAALFAGPYQPQVLPGEAPPQSAAVSWLQQHADGRPVAAIGLGTLIPQSATLYGLSDVRAYDVLQPLGARAFWSLADPDYYNDGLNVWLFHPSAEWLAAAGVAYAINPGNQPLPGTTIAYQGEGVTISGVSGTRPFAFASDAVVCAASPDAVKTVLAQRGPLGPVVLQTSDCPSSSPATVRVGERQAERINLSVDATLPTVVVILQSYTRDWAATMDGRRADILPANLQFQAVAVPAGVHQLSLTYAPSAVGLGEIITVVALAALLVLCGGELVRRARVRMKPVNVPVA